MSLQWVALLELESKTKKRKPDKRQQERKQWGGKRTVLAMASEGTSGRCREAAAAVVVTLTVLVCGFGRWAPREEGVWRGNNRNQRRRGRRLDLGEENEWHFFGLICVCLPQALKPIKLLSNSLFRSTRGCSSSCLSPPPPLEDCVWIIMVIHSLICYVAYIKNWVIA